MSLSQCKHKKGRTFTRAMWSTVFGNPIWSIFDTDLVMACDFTVTCQGLPSSENNDDRQKLYQVCFDFLWYEIEESHKFDYVKKNGWVRNYFQVFLVRQMLNHQCLLDHFNSSTMINEMIANGVSCNMKFCKSENKHWYRTFYICIYSFIMCLFTYW